MSAETTALPFKAIGKTLEQLSVSVFLDGQSQPGMAEVAPAFELGSGMFWAVMPKECFVTACAVTWQVYCDGEPLHCPSTHVNVTDIEALAQAVIKCLCEGEYATSISAD